MTVASSEAAAVSAAPQPLNFCPPTSGIRSQPDFPLVKAEKLPHIPRPLLSWAIL
jgi:hypothetical protein